MPDIPWRFAKSLYSKKEREAARLTIAEGPPSVTSALESGAEVQFLISSESFVKSEGWDDLLRLAQTRTDGFTQYVMPDALFDRMSEVRSPQGVLCVMPYPFRFPQGKTPASPWDTPLYVYAFDIQDPGNAGTILRAAAASGVTAAAFCGDAVDVYSPKCIRASAGAVFKVKLEEPPGDDPVDILEGLVSRGVAVYKTSPRGGKPPWEAAFTENCAIVVGNEAHGLSRKVLDGPGEAITIPMPGDTESLNVAIASGVMLYEAVRQRLVSKPRS